MGKMSELAVDLSELKRCGETLISLSESITELPMPAPGKKGPLTMSRWRRQSQKRAL